MSNIDVCEELLVEILSRLPTKSLLRFRSLSKSLCACIGSPGFIRIHTRRSPEKVMIKHQVFFQGKTCSIDMYSLHSRAQLKSNDPYASATPVEYPLFTFRIVGSCHGIFCLYKFGHGINLWNPSIRRKVTVHHRPSWAEFAGHWVPLGFGFDPVLRDYKILIRVYCNTGKGFVGGTFVYTMKTSEWHEIASTIVDRLSYVNTRQRLFNGALHWVVSQRFADSGPDCYYYILAFDLSSEVFSRIDLPEPSWKTNDVTIINASLAVISTKHDDSWIWVRNNTTASWSVAFKLSTREFERPTAVFQFTGNNDLVFNSYGGIIVYNPETRERSSLADASTASSLVGAIGACRGLCMIPCIESLGLLDMGTSCDKERGKEREAEHKFSFVR